MASRSRLFSKIAKDIGSDGNLSAAALSPDVSFGATVYDSTGLLPYVGNDTGDQAYVKSNNRFYIWDSIGWYNVALINKAPNIASVLDSDGGTSPFALAIDGTATTITITATDSDGDPITYSATTDGNFSGLATLSQDGNVFTITPLSQDSATTTSGTITFKATDGINIASDINTFTLNFSSALWDETVVSIGTSSTNSLANSTFIDRSSNAHTVTTGGSLVQTAFHPYLDNWSVDLAPTDYLSTPNSTDFLLENSDFTIEAWIYITEHGSLASGISSVYNSSLNQRSWYFGVTSSSINFNFSTNGYSATNVALSHAATINTNKWYWVSVTRSGDTFSFYVDGNRVGTSTNSSSFFNSNQPHVIGDGNIAGTDVRFGGYISNYRLIKGQAIYTDAIVNVPSSNLQNISGTSLLACQSNRFVDNSSNSHTVTISGTPEVSAYNPFGQVSEYAPGENKGSGSFDGSTNYIEISNRLGGLSNSGWTFEAWIYLHDTATNSYVFNQHGSSTTNNFGIGSTGFPAQIYGGNASNENGTLLYDTSVFVKQWAHLVVQYENPGYKFYVNGDLVGTHPNISSYWDHPGLATTKLGVYYYSSFNSYFNGYMADVKITPNQIVYSDGYTVPTSPVGNTNAALYLPMDNAGIYDKTGNHNITITGDTKTSTTQTKYAATSMYFDGSDYVDMYGPGLNLSSNVFTIEAWVYRTGTGNQQNLYMAAPPHNVLSISLNRTGGGNTYVYVGNGSSWTALPAINSGASSPIGANTWAHVALTCDGTTLRLFHDGTLVGSSTTLPSGFQGYTRIGAYELNGTAGEYLTGYVEDFQILNGVAKYTSNFTPPAQTQGRQYQAES